ncbi:MAG TPA: hypothetical protein VI520_03515 [Anaerolineales bacterium]|nr:hypothetical protein [Anaerolineales bacterium]
MTDPEFQLRVLESAVGELESYLLSPEVFWRVSGAADLPNLTLGGLELARRALVATIGKLDPAARPRAHIVIEQIDEFRRQSRFAWERKAASELKVRLNQWQAYLQDLAEQPGESERYPQEVRARAMATYLLEEAAHQPQADETLKRLEALDARLRVSFASGIFIWDPSLAEAYPAGTHWFLYGRPKT